MAKKAESRLQKRIQDRLKSTVGGWWFKVWGGPFTPAGIPDLIGCVDGLFFALEVKLPNDRKSQPSEIQLETIRDIAMKGGGVATIVRSPEEAEAIVTEALARAATRLQVRYLTSRQRTAMRTAHWENLRHSGDPEKAGGSTDQSDDR